MDKSRSSRLLRSAVLVALTAPALNAYADLNLVPGMSGAEAPVAANIQFICPQLVRDQQTLNAEQTQLRLACTRMVQTSNALPGQTGNTTFSLGLSESELRTGIRAIGNEEFSSAPRRSIETKSKNAVNGRLLALRGGARGLTLSELSVQQGGRKVDVAGMLPAGTRGGGASSDDQRWGGFLNVQHANGDRDGSGLEDPFDFKNTSVTGGVDYRVNDSLAVGAALSYDESEVDFDNSLGNVDSDSKAFTVYGTWSQGNLYFDGHVTFSRMSFDSVRNIVIPSRTAVSGINAVATAHPDADQVAATLGVGYQMKVGQGTLSPFGRLEYLRLKVDGFTESEPVHSLGLDVQARTVKSLQSAVGARYQMPINTNFGVLVPYASLEWNHEFDNDQGAVVAKYTHDPFSSGFVLPTDSPDRNFFSWSVGLQAQFARGMSAFLNLDTVSGLRGVDYLGVTAGLRVEF